MRLFSAVSVAAVLSLGAPIAISAQAEPGEDRFTLSLVGGSFHPTSELQIGENYNRFDEAWSVGGAATLWATRNLGVRASLLWAPSEAIAVPGRGATFEGEDPRFLSYSGDILFRFPLESDFHWYPYLLVGVGGKQYSFETLDSQTHLAGSLGTGFEVRFGEASNWGFGGELRSILSSFDSFGFDETQNDVALTVGVSFSF